PVSLAKTSWDQIKILGPATANSEQKQTVLADREVTDLPRDVRHAARRNLKPSLWGRRREQLNGVLAGEADLTQRSLPHHTGFGRCGQELRCRQPRCRFIERNT